MVAVLSVDAAASDWFARPEGGSYGSEDGSSYLNAWDGLQNVVWGLGGVQAGDTLYPQQSTQMAGSCRGGKEHCGCVEE